MGERGEGATQILYSNQYTESFHRRSWCQKRENRRIVVYAAHEIESNLNMFYDTVYLIYYCILSPNNGLYNLNVKKTVLYDD